MVGHPPHAPQCGKPYPLESGEEKGGVDCFKKDPKEGPGIFLFYVGCLAKKEMAEF